MEAPIHVSNVKMLEDDKKPTRVEQPLDEEGGHEGRIATQSGEDI